MEIKELQDGEWSEVYSFHSHIRWVNKASTHVFKGDVCIDAKGMICNNGKDFKEATYPIVVMRRVGKKKAGRELDGQTHDELPCWGNNA